MSDDSPIASDMPASPEGRLDDLIESVSDAFYAVDRAWRLVVFNRAAEEFFGLPREEVLGRSIWEIWPSGRETPFGRACESAMERAVVSQMEAPSAFRPGRTVELRIGPLRAGGVSVALRDVTERAHAQQRMREAEEHLKLMVLELNHRVKNNLATVQAIAVQTLRGAETPEAAREAFVQRIAALAAAHDILTREQWEGVGVADIADGVLRALDGASDRVRLEGPEVRLLPKTALALSMAFHELGTNALKYGALSRPEGQVRVRWEVAETSDRTLEVRWAETGGPAVVPPERRGFGSRLLERGLANELRGEVQVRYEPEGVRCLIRTPLEGTTS